MSYPLYGAKKIRLIDYYATSLTLSVWILLAYIFYADHWWLFVLLLVVIGIVTSVLSFVMALKNEEGSANRAKKQTKKTHAGFLISV